jgi:kexin
VEFVNAAMNWESVKPQAWIEMPTVQIENGTMDIFQTMSGGADIVADGVTSKMEVTEDLLHGHNFEKLEHITVKVWIQHNRRGDVEVELVSPLGVKSVLAGKRHADADATGFPGWTFSTIKHWYVCATYLGLLRSESYIGTRILLASGRSASQIKRTTLMRASSWAGP